MRKRKTFELVDEKYFKLKAAKAAGRKLQQKRYKDSNLQLRNEWRKNQQRNNYRLKHGIPLNAPLFKRRPKNET